MIALPASSQKVIEYNWPVIGYYAQLQVNKGLTKEELLKVMQEYLDNKTFLVREKKEFLRRVGELF